MSETARWCHDCAAETWFEVVLVEGALDGELGCVDCGAAVVVGILVPGLLQLDELPGRPDQPVITHSEATGTTGTTGTKAHDTAHDIDARDTDATEDTAAGTSSRSVPMAA